jgi:hypothetical protein
VWQVTSIIQTTTDSESGISALVAFPKAEFLLGPPARDHIRNLALLRLSDGTVWMLTLRGAVWSDERLRTAAGVLRRASRLAFTTSSIESLLRRELEIRSVFLESPPVDQVDSRQWDIEKVAFALVRQPGAGRSTEACRERQEWTTRTALRDALDEALGSFVDGMAPSALRAATRTRHLDLRIYNYLAHREYRQYRLQFARTFPGLLLTAVVAEPRSFGEDLRSIVDSGAPLVKGLAARWQVRPGVIRHLVGRASSDMGIQWMRDAKGLALALNALHPQDLPGDSPAEWSEFNRIVATGLRLFVRPIWESSAGLEWLRECVRRAKRKDRQALERWLPKWNELARIDHLRNALSEILHRESADTMRRSPDGAGTSIADALDAAVLSMARRGLSDVASMFSDELEKTRRKDSTTRQILFGDALMPLIPEDFVSSDGATRVTSLTTDRQLRTHGRRMRNCLRSSSARQVARQATVGTLFIVGLYDAQSGRPLSTAEIKVIPNRETGTYRLVTKQHTAMANRPPSRRCHYALGEFLHYCHTDDVRDHLKTGWRKLARLHEQNGMQPVNLPTALRCTLGDELYEELLGQVRETSDSGSEIVVNAACL